MLQARKADQNNVATVFKADPLDPARGKQYREKILRAGGSREELESLEVFLVSLPLAWVSY